MDSMKHCKTLLVIAGLLMMSTAAHAGSATGGEDINPGSDVPFTVEERTTPSQDGQDWSLSVVLDQDALDNGTTLAITTQICLNNGVCDPPVAQTAAPSRWNSSHPLTTPTSTGGSRQRTATIQRRTSRKATGTRPGPPATTTMVPTGASMPTAMAAMCQAQERRPKASFQVLVS